VSLHTILIGALVWLFLLGAVLAPFVVPAFVASLYWRLRAWHLTVAAVRAQRESARKERVR